MSFVVSFNGQFKTYELPDLSHFDRVARVYKAPDTYSVEPEDERSDHPDYQKETPKRHTRVKAFAEVDAEFQKERETTYAKDLMSSPVHTLNEDESLNSLEGFFNRYSIRHIPILNSEGVLVGLVSDRDLLESKRSSAVQIKKIMTQEVLTAQHTARIADIAKLMLHEKIGAMPVVDNANSLVGIVTLTDILGAIVRQGGL